MVKFCRQKRYNYTFLFLENRVVIARIGPTSGLAANLAEFELSVSFAGLVYRT